MPGSAVPAAAASLIAAYGARVVGDDGGAGAGHHAQALVRADPGLRVHVLRRDPQVTVAALVGHHGVAVLQGGEAGAGSRLHGQARVHGRIAVGRPQVAVEALEHRQDEGVEAVVVVAGAGARRRGLAVGSGLGQDVVAGHPVDVPHLIVADRDGDEVGVLGGGDGTVVDGGDGGAAARRHEHVRVVGAVGPGGPQDAAAGAERHLKAAAL